MVNDGSFLHELVAYSIYRRLGVAAPRVGYTRLLLNGELMGLYAIIETPDDVWLDRSFKEEDGNLYEADYLLYPDGSYTLIDFRPEVDDYFSQEEGEDIGHADIFAITDLATAAMGTDHFAADPVRRHLLHRDVRELAPAGATLYAPRPYHRPEGSPALDENLLTYDHNVWLGLGIENPSYAWLDALWMEIVLLEPLRASYREHGFTRLCACRCRVPWLEADFPTLNQALAAIVRLCEPHRQSSTANALREIIAPFAGPVSDRESWFSLADHAAHLAYREPAPQPAQLSLPLHFN
jgi:hypothetical protein